MAKAQTGEQTETAAFLLGGAETPPQSQHPALTQPEAMRAEELAAAAADNRKVHANAEAPPEKSGGPTGDAPRLKRQERAGTTPEMGLVNYQQQQAGHTAMVCSAAAKNPQHQPTDPMISDPEQKRQRTYAQATSQLLAAVHTADHPICTPVPGFHVWYMGAYGISGLYIWYIYIGIRTFIYRLAVGLGLPYPSWLITMVNESLMMNTFLN